MLSFPIARNLQDARQARALLTLLAVVCSSLLVSCGDTTTNGNTRIAFQAPITFSGFCVTVDDGLFDPSDPPPDDGSLDWEVSNGFERDCGPDTAIMEDPPVEAGSSYEALLLLPPGAEYRVEVTVLGDRSSCTGIGIRPDTHKIARVEVDFDACE